MIATAHAASTILPLALALATPASLTAQAFDERLRELVSPDSSAAPIDSARVDPVPDGTKAPSDSTALDPSVVDTLAATLPLGFGPRDATGGAFLRPAPSPAHELEHLTAFDAFLLPPEGPSLVFDRADLRLAGHTEWWDIAYLVPGLFTLRPGYPGTVTPFSFRARGPDGTKILYDGRALAGGYTPIENPNVVGRGHLAGAAVMRVGASHLYGPGAGAGALLLMPAASAPARPFSEAATMTGIFGQRSGSFTTAFHFAGAGILFEYDGAAANTWSLFDGYRAERYHGRLDWSSGGTTLLATVHGHDEKLKHFEPLDKRGDEGYELTAAAEHRSGPWLSALRGIRHESMIRADGPDGFSWQDLERWEAELLLQRSVGERGSAGVLGGIHRDRRERRDVFGRLEVRTDTGGYALARLRTDVAGFVVDAAGRWDHLTSGQDVVAVGATASRSVGGRGTLWLHAARTIDRPAYFQRISDAYTQVDQGLDLPWPGGIDPPTGLVGAAGFAARVGRLSLELGGSLDRTDRVFAQFPAPLTGPLALDEPDRWRRERVESAGGWTSFELGPVWLGRILGSFALGASAFVSSSPDVPGLQVEPHRYGETWGRLRKDLFGGALRLEGEVGWEMLGAMPTPVGNLEAQSQLTARVAAQIGDAIVYYRSENIINQEFFSSAYDEELGFVEITSQNVTVGASWVLVD